MAKLNPIGQLRKKIKQLDLSDILDKCLVETSDILIALVKSQLELGQTSVGIITPTLKNERYAIKKQSDGSKAPLGIPDLKRTGAFYSKFKVRMFINSVRVRSTDKKASIILNKYGPEIYELNPDSLEHYLNNVIEPLMIKKIQNGL